MGLRSTRRRACVLSLFSFACAATYAQQTAVLGPLEQINQYDSTLTVLGQSFDLPSSVLVTIGGKKYSLATALRLLQPGKYVSVVGDATSNGRALAKEILVSPRPYVPGASEVFISGVVTSYDRSVGQATVGELVIDVTPTLASDTSPQIEVGSAIDVFGNQAVVGGIVWAVDLKIRSVADLQSISGTGASTQSISGTGKSLSTQSISGTGSSLSTQSISGTGASTQSISGTGKSLSTQSISGTGSSLSTQSISGTGASTQSISGTGRSLSTQSISGTGSSLSTQSISGTGASTQSISGTGRSSSMQSISGTGAN